MTIHRRTFVQAATALAVGAAGTRVAQAQAPAPAQLMPTAPAAAGTMTALPDLSSLDPKAPPPPKPDGVPAPTMKRFQEQRWVLDNIIRANGIDWDQPRLPGLAAALGPEATNDITAIRSRVQKFADITPAFEAVARRRETRAIEAQNAGDLVGARDNYFMAANYWGGAQWPIDENNDKNIFFNQKKRECYLKYAKVADHRVEPAWIAIEGKTVPAWFHLPYRYQSGQRVPCVVSIPGMDALGGSVSVTRDRRAGSGRARPIRERPPGHPGQRPGLASRRPGDVQLAGRTSGNRCSENRNHRFELRFSLFHHRGVGRAALCSGRSRGHVSRARMPYDLPGGLADL